jgi:beta-lactamase regulating signal transducer with metallopeptidase domain
MIGLLPQTLPQLVVERLLNGALEGMVLAALAWVLLKVVGRRSSSTRFAVWFVVLVAVGALPWMQSRHWASAAVSTSSSSSSIKSAILMPASWAQGLFYIWAVVAALSLGRVVLGLWQIRRLRLNSSRLDLTSIDPALRQALAAACNRPISLHVSRTVRVPMATGFFRPMIVIPEWSLRELTVDELKAVLLHEAAHLQRRDDWTNLAQKLLRAVLFFHPVVWWLESKLALEREMACDDLVIEATSSPRAYAACLVALAEKSLGRRNLTMAQAAVTRMQQTSQRIRLILDAKHPRATAMWKPAVGFAATAATACLLVVGEAPKLIGFAAPADAVHASARVVAQGFPPLPVGQSLIRRTSLAFTSPRTRTTKRTVRPAVPEPEVKQTEVAANQSEEARALPAKLDEAIQPSFLQPLFLQPPSQSSFRPVSFTAEETVFVVMQDQQITAAGDKVVRFNVYRLTVFYPEFYPGPQKPLNKSI